MFKKSMATIVVVSVLFTVGNAAAQKSKDGDVLPPVRVALVAELPAPSLAISQRMPGARAMVIRKGGDRNEDLVLVTAATTGPDLALATAMLLRGRQSKFKKETGEIRAYVQPTTNRNIRGVPYSERLLTRLRTAPSQSVRGFGVVRTLEMTIKVKTANKKSN